MKLCNIEEQPMKRRSKARLQAIIMLLKVLWIFIDTDIKIFHQSSVGFFSWLFQQSTKQYLITHELMKINQQKNRKCFLGN